MTTAHFEGLAEDLEAAWHDDATDTRLKKRSVRSKLLQLNTERSRSPRYSRKITPASIVRPGCGAKSLMNEVW